MYFPNRTTHKTISIIFQTNELNKIINKFQNNKTHEAVLETLKRSEIGNKILDTKLPLSTVRQKETMLMKFNSITDKNHIGILTNELIQKGVL